MLFVTGDCHGDFRRFSARAFPKQKELVRGDYVLVLGDFGGLWDGSRSEERRLDELARRNPTFLFIDGNHENYDLLEQYPTILWKGGVARCIRDNVFHLCRGHVFSLSGRRVLAMGGAQTHDAEVILPRGSGRADRRPLDYRQIPYRVEGSSWWPRELPDGLEYSRCIAALNREDWSVDLVLSHCAPTDIQRRIAPNYPVNQLTDYLQTVKDRLMYRQWYCGHYHKTIHMADERFHVVGEEIIPVE